MSWNQRSPAFEIEFFFFVFRLVKKKMLVRVFAEDKTTFFRSVARFRCVLPYSIDSHWFMVAVFDEDDKNKNPWVYELDRSNPNHTLLYNGPHSWYNHIQRNNNNAAFIAKTDWIRIPLRRCQWETHLEQVSRGYVGQFSFRDNCQTFVTRALSPWCPSLTTFGDFVTIIMVITAVLSILFHTLLSF